jgi:methyl-accepting chemotaxis protein
MPWGAASTSWRPNFKKREIRMMNFNIGARLGLGFCAVLLIGVMIGALGVDAARSSNFALIALLAATAAVGAALAWWITRSITRPLADAVDAAQAVAAGDLVVDIQVKSNDETGRLLASLAAMRRQTAEAVGASSSEIARGNQDLSSRTEEQASNLEKTSSSMEELATTVRQNADNARQANQLAMGASDVAARGGDAVRGVATTMGGINDASSRIADIIGVIDGIAFQTNILALNAAVEAARAGEQGRGFAVVASEVRSLAQRSAEAAKEIKTLIQDSVARVEAGTKQVDGAGKTMDEIMGAVKRVTDIMGEIAAASAEQLRGIEQVSTAMSQMDRVVQQNAALVEESAAAAENMAGQAESLVGSVVRFKLKGGAPVAPVAPRIEVQAKVVEKPAALPHTPKVAPKPLRSPKLATAAMSPALAGADDGDWKEI